MLKQLGLPAGALLRRKEKLYKELELESAGDADALKAMAGHPILIERPVVIHGNKAVLGRPPEKALDLL